MLLTVLRAVVVTFYWVMVKLVVSPVEGLLQINGWRAELRLTASLTFSTIERGEVFDRTIPMQIWFPREVPARCGCTNYGDGRLQACLNAGKGIISLQDIGNVFCDNRYSVDFCEWRKEQGRANALSLRGGGDAELYGDEAEKERRAAELSSDGDEAEKERSALHAVPAVQRM
ncbi:hypothetical protein EI94DRAFT_1700938 [Lactarius quietus]|nr:hypothetical protein EI94DRAFT_1700938 [Lactarius quietus]